VDKHQLPPRAEEAEQIILGSMFRDAGHIDELVSTLGEQELYFDRHQKIFRAILELHRDSKPTEMSAVAERLHAKGQIEDIGGYAYLVDLLDSAVTGVTVGYYAAIVRDKAMTRALIHVSEEILKDAQDEVEPAGQLVDAAERRILEIGERFAHAHHAKTFPELLIEAQNRADARKRKEITAGIPTGFADVDEALGGGLQESELSIIAARPSVGKTAFACNVARFAAMEAGVPTLFISLEQSALELTDRLICCQGRVDSYALRTGRQSKDDESRIMSATEELRRIPLYIEDRPALTPLRIAAMVRRYHRRQGVKLVLIDYLQLIEAEDRRENRVSQVDLISKRLKQIARELRVAVVACCQVNRAAEDGRDRRPRLHHLRESGGIEANADMVLILFRGKDDDDSTESPQRTLIGFDVAKNRNGPTGENLLVFEKRFMRFENYSKGLL